MRNMWTGIEQQGATEMLNEPQVPALVEKDPSGVSRIEHARMARTTAHSPRSEAGHDSASAVEWLSSAIVHDLRNPLGAIYSAAEMLIRLDSTTT
jgi:nitrogen-specific signal transduction histidine kinase